MINCPQSTMFFFRNAVEVRTDFKKSKMYKISGTKFNELQEVVKLTSVQFIKFGHRLKSLSKQYFGRSLGQNVVTIDK